jgi:hypothetical protein
MASNSSALTYIQRYVLAMEVGSPTQALVTDDMASRLKMTKTLFGVTSQGLPLSNPELMLQVGMQWANHECFQLVPLSTFVYALSSFA